MQKRLAETKSCFYRQSYTDERAKTSDNKKRVIHSSQEPKASSYREVQKGDFEGNNFEENKKLVFKKLAYLDKLGLYQAEIFIQGNRFIIEVNPMSTNSNKLFIIEFDNHEGNFVVNLDVKNIFKSYEHILGCLKFNEKNILINTKKHIVYVTILLILANKSYWEG
jgi:hypothetical protein